MRKVFIVHGLQGSPNGGWRPWLMGELEKKDVYAAALAMPNPDEPILSEWVREIARHVEGNPVDHIYLVGHSLGVPAILRYLEKTKSKNIKGIVLVSGPIFGTANKKVLKFLKTPFDFKKIKSKVEKIVVIHGGDDRAVPVEQGIRLSQELVGRLIIIKNGGHLNGSSGWYRLPECLESLDEMLG